MDKQKILDQLNINRDKILMKDTSPKINILATMQIAKTESEIFKERVAVFEVGGCYYWKEYTKDLPNTIIGATVISTLEADIILETISKYDQYKHYHLNPYTWLVCGCLLEGLDLVSEGLIQI